MLALLTPRPPTFTNLCWRCSALPSAYEGQVLQNRELRGARLVVLELGAGAGVLAMAFPLAAWPLGGYFNSEPHFQTLQRGSNREREMA